MGNYGSNPVSGPPGAYRGGGLVRGVLGGLVAAVAAAIVWALIAQLTGYQLEFAAVGVGLLVGQAVAVTGRGRRGLPAVAALLTLVGCALGEVLQQAQGVAAVIGLETLAVLRQMVTHPDLIRSVFLAGFTPLSAVFWAVAALAGYRLAARPAKVVGYRPPAPQPRAVPGPEFTGFGANPSSAPSPVPPAAVLARHPSDFFSAAGESGPLPTTYRASHPANRRPHRQVSGPVPEPAPSVGPDGGTAHPIPARQSIAARAPRTI